MYCLKLKGLPVRSGQVTRIQKIKFHLYTIEKGVIKFVVKNCHYGFASSLWEVVKFVKKARTTQKEEKPCTYRIYGKQATAGYFAPFDATNGQFVSNLFYATIIDESHKQKALEYISKLNSDNADSIFELRKVIQCK